MALMFILFLAFFGAMFFGVMRGGPEGPPLVFMAFMWIFMALIYASMIVPSFIAGFGLLKGKKWARTASIIAGVISAMQFPLGTAVCVYTFWFLFSEPGKQIFEQNRLGLPPAHQPWLSEALPEKELRYVPPSTPPDWR